MSAAIIPTATKMGSTEAIKLEIRLNLQFYYCKISLLQNFMDHTGCLAFEQVHVHDVYDQIAEHFSATRYKVERQF